MHRGFVGLINALGNAGSTKTITGSPRLGLSPIIRMSKQEMRDVIC
jgi:hypothetical protein